MKIKFNNIKDIEEFTHILWLHGVEADLHSGRRAVDARSILGILSLDFNKSFELIVVSIRDGEKDKLEEALHKFKEIA